MEDIKPGESHDQVIESISKAAEEFVNSNEVYDRDEISEKLKVIEKGDLVILTGGPSTGKSLVVNHLFGNQSNYMYLDGRLTGPNIIDAVIDNLIERDRLRSLTVKSLKNTAPLFISLLNDFFGNENSDKLKLPDILIKVLEVVTKSPEKAPKSLSFILQLMSSLDTPIEGIIFDEANKYFTAESLPLLDCLTALTKQNRKLAVVMATSDYGFTFSLNKIGYNRNHISQSLVLSDVSPGDMLRLLSSWGVRPSLAYLLVEIYGGHILQISRALVDLHHKKDKAGINMSFISGLSSQFAVCIKESIETGIEEKVTEALNTLMRTGFFACDFTDSVAALLIKFNIAGFIEKQSEVPGLSKMVRGERSGLVPSTQMIRVVYSLDI